MPQDPLFLVTVNLCVVVCVRVLKPNLLTAALLAIVTIISTGYLGKEYGSEIIYSVYRGRDLALTLTGHPPSWPAEINRTYPDLELVDQEGKLTRLSDFRGRVILLQPIGMSSRISVSFAGGGHRGAFRRVEPQPKIGSIVDYARKFGQVDLHDERIVQVHLLLFNRNMKPPSRLEVRRWARHFNLKKSRNEIVLAGTAELASPASRDLIPGFQLIDRNFMLRADATGSNPQDDLYRDLLPMIPKLLTE